MTEIIRLPTASGRRNRSGLWPTTTLSALGAIIENCRICGQLGLITGPSGIGKTTAALAAVRKIAEAHEDAEEDEDQDCGSVAHYVSMTQAAGNIQPGLLRISKAVGLHVSNHLGAPDVHDALASHHWPRGSLVAIDEAQLMSDDLLEGVRNLWDELEQNGTPVSFVLIGSAKLAARIKDGNKKTGRFDPLRGRLGAVVELPAIEPNDCAAISRHLGMTDRQSEGLIRRTATAPGGLHNVKRLIAQAERVAGPKKRLAFVDLKNAAELAGVAS